MGAGQSRDQQVPMAGDSWELQLTGVWGVLDCAFACRTLRTANTLMYHIFSALPPTSTLFHLLYIKSGVFKNCSLLNCNNFKGICLCVRCELACIISAAQFAPVPVYAVYGTTSFSY